MKKKKTVLDVQFPLTKRLATSQDRQILQNYDEKQVCQFWIVRLVDFTRLPANRDCLLKLHMLVKLAISFSRTSLEETCLHWAYFVVNSGCCDNTLLLCKTCLHAVYHRPIIGVRKGILLRGAEKLL